MHLPYSSFVTGIGVQKISAGFVTLNSNVPCGFVFVCSILVPVFLVIKPEIPAFLLFD